MKSFNEFNEYLLEKLITFGGKAYPKFGNVVILAGGGGCFSGNTLVKMEDGYKKISEIVTGDKVWTFNEETEEKVLNVVNELFEYTEHADQLLELTFENGETVVCTDNHEFWIDGQWIKAKDLVVEN
jgi:intein/homing endonuclease